MNILKHSMMIVMLVFTMANTSLVNAEEVDSSKVPPMMNGYGMPMMGGQWGGPSSTGQWNGMPMMHGQWGSMPMMGGQWNGMPMMGSYWNGPMMHGGWEGMPCLHGGYMQQLEQRLISIEEKLDKVVSRQRSK